MTRSFMSSNLLLYYTMVCWILTATNWQKKPKTGLARIPSPLPRNEQNKTKSTNFQKTFMGESLRHDQACQVGRKRSTCILKGISEFGFERITCAD